MYTINTVNNLLWIALHRWWIPNGIHPVDLVKLLASLISININFKPMVLQKHVNNASSIRTYQIHS